jgi:hypothetical protein
MGQDQFNSERRIRMWQAIAETYCAPQMKFFADEVTVIMYSRQHVVKYELHLCPTYLTVTKLIAVL